MARIAQVVCSDGFAGVERHVASLSAGLAARGHDVVLLGGDHRRVPAAIAATGDGGVEWRPADTVPAAVRELVRLGRVDLVHVHMTEAELAGVLTRPRHRAPVVSTRHFARSRGSSPRARRISPLIRRGLAAQLSVSAWVAAAIGEPSIVVPSGVPVLADVGSAEREPVVLVVSRLEAEKRVDVALEAWRSSGLADSGWRLDIAGDGQLRADLAARARELGITDSVRFLGVRDDVPQLLDAAAIVLAPCPVEAFGLALVEAMSHATPVVAARQGAHAELLAGIPAAALFDVADLSTAGQLLSDLAADPPRRAAYGSRLRDRQRECYSLDRQVAATLAVYAELW